MITNNPQGGTLQSRQFEGIKEQNQFIIQQLKRQKDSGRAGILYRNNLSAICLANALDRANIPFYIRESGKQRFFSHWVVNDILNFLRFSFAQQEATFVDFAKRLTHLEEQMLSSYKNKHS